MDKESSSRDWLEKPEVNELRVRTELPCFLEKAPGSARPSLSSLMLRFLGIQIKEINVENLYSYVVITRIMLAL